MKGPACRISAAASLGLLFLSFSASADVRVVLRMPEGVSVEAQEKLNATEPRILGLVGLGAGKSLVEDTENGMAELRFTASTWTLQQAEEAAESIELLKAVWGKDNIRFEERPEGFEPRAQQEKSPELSRRAELAAAKKTLDMSAAAGAKDPAAFYDNSAVRDALASSQTSEMRRFGTSRTNAVRMFGTPLMPWTRVAAKASPAGSLGFPRAIETVGANLSKDVPLPDVLNLPHAVGSIRPELLRSDVRDAVPLGPYEAVIQSEAKAAGISPDVLRALVAAKGGFEAKPGRASGGSYGLLLITPGAAKAVGMKAADLKNPETNIRVGAKLLSKLLDFFHGDVHRALAAYQVGTGKVVRSGGIPNDPEVKYLLAAYERAYRQGPSKPKVEAVRPVKSPTLKAVRDQVKQAITPLPAASIPTKDPVARYRKTIEIIAGKRGLDPKLVEAVMRAENPWGNPMVVSDAGAVGLMQLMPGTARRLGVNPRNPEQNIDGGVRHLTRLLELYDGDKVLAVAAYNAGEGRVKTRIPNFPETKNYVRKVLGYYADLGGESLDCSDYMPPSRRDSRTY
ncbi:MAG: lytic transglycosylase domain-containing protein [Elusimicrobia bacterium]|nr:lytic transglycosylase domain-containing protein [Elusimicrobiota bacterium]